MKLDPWGDEVDSDTCENCWGTGDVLEKGCRCLSCYETCPTCDGSGKV